MWIMLLEFLEYLQYLLLFCLGHTHGGQIFPITIGAYLFNPYYAGLYKHGENSHVYVSMGTVYWGFPMRLGTSSEISVIRLRPLEH